MAELNTAIFQQIRPQSVNDYTAQMDAADARKLDLQNNKLGLILQQENVNNAPVRADMLKLQLQGAQLGNQKAQMQNAFLRDFQGSQAPAQPATTPSANGAPSPSNSSHPVLDGLEQVQSPQDALAWAQGKLNQGLITPAQYQAGAQKIQATAGDPQAFAQWKQQTLQDGASVLAQSQQAAVAQIPPQIQSRLASMGVDQIAKGVMLGVIPKEMADLWLKAKFGNGLQPGYRQNIDGSVDYLPDPTKGITIDPRTNGVSVLPGAAQAQATIAGATAGATTGAQEAAKAPYTLVENYDPSTKQMVKTPLTSILQGQQPPPASPVQPFQGSSILDSADPAVRDKILYNAQKFGDRQFNVAVDTPGGAINQGFVDRAATGVPQTAGNPLAQQTAPSGVPTGPSQDEKITAAFRQNQLTKAHDSNQKVLDDLNDTVRNEAELQNRNAQILPLLDQYKTGGFSPEGRLHLANAIQNTGWLPDSVASSIAKSVVAGDPSAGKTIENQLATAGIKTMLDALDKEGKPNRAIFMALQNAQEGLKSGNTSLQQVFNLQKQLYDWHYGQQQQLSGGMAAPDYNPLTLQQQFSAARNTSLKNMQPVLGSSTVTAPAAAANQPTALKSGADLGGGFRLK